MKALIIKIRDAGVFKAPRVSGSQDKVLSMNSQSGGSHEYTSRFDKRTKTCTPYFKIPAGKLCVKHVANLLRVLWGQRPVPTLRKIDVKFKGEIYFEDLAKKVRVKIESLILPIDKGHKEGPYYPEETATIRKSIGDSWQTAAQPYFLDGTYKQIKGGLLYPDRLRRFLGVALYMQFNALVEKFGGASTVKEGIELLNVHKVDSGVVSFCSDCKINGKTSLSNIILNSSPESVTIHSSPSIPLNLLMASSTVQDIEKFNATLYVPITDEDLARIKEGTGVATYLEGGLATIEGVESWSEIFEVHELTVEGELCI